jgi:hypothetical protein
MEQCQASFEHKQLLGGIILDRDTDFRVVVWAGSLCNVFSTLQAVVWQFQFGLVVPLAGYQGCRFYLFTLNLDASGGFGGISTFQSSTSTRFPSKPTTLGGDDSD